VPNSIPTHRPRWLPTKQERDRHFQRVRGDKEAQAFYHSAAWLQLKEMKLCDQPWCEEHLRQGEYVGATIVHHIKEVKQEPALRLEMSNLMSVCKSCHSRIHANV